MRSRILSPLQTSANPGHLRDKIKTVLNPRNSRTKPLALAELLCAPLTESRICPTELKLLFDKARRWRCICACFWNASSSLREEGTQSSSCAHVIQVWSWICRDTKDVVLFPTNTTGSNAGRRCECKKIYAVKHTHHFQMCYSCDFYLVSKNKLVLFLEIAEIHLWNTLSRCVFMDSMSTSEFPTVKSLKRIEIFQIMNLYYD